jgi:hypothetical protein
MKRPQPVTVLLLVLVLAGYGIPLTRAWLQARALRADKAALTAEIKRRIDTEKGSMVRSGWMATLAERVGGNESKRVLLAYANDPNHMLRAFSVYNLMKYHRDDPEALEAIRAFLNNPREMMWTRYLSLKYDFPDLRDSPIGQEGQRVIDAQRDLFPPTGYFP